MTAGATYEVEAYNTATASTNRIHADDVARTYGFRGGLVPGVDVYAYLTQAPVARWGRSWLEDGTIEARFQRPVYDGDLVTVALTAGTDDRLDLELRDGEGTTCATATAGLGGPPVTAPLPPAQPRVDVRAPASPDSLRPGTALGSLRETFEASLHASYLADVRETQSLYADARIAHPGWMLRLANRILSRHVELGPWIHVGSDVRLLGVVDDGEELEVLAVVEDEYERKGHRFVVLDVAAVGRGRTVQRVRHTAIHTPRPVA